MDATQQIGDSFVEEEYSEDEEKGPEGRKEKEPLAALKVFNNSYMPETEIPLYLGENVLGRDPIFCSMSLQAPSISRRHAVISISQFRPHNRLHGDGKTTEALVWDLGSLNGTRKGHFKLTPQVRYALADGDGVVLADLPCQYVSPESMVRPARAASEVGQAATRGGGSIEGTEGGVKNVAEGSALPNPAPAQNAKPEIRDQAPPKMTLQPERAIVPNSDSDSDEDGDRRRGRRFLGSASSDLSGPTCSTFLTPANKIIPESEDESSITPSSAMVSRSVKSEASLDSKFAPLMFNMDSDSDVEKEETTNGESKVTTATVAQQENRINPDNFHVDSDTDIEEEVEKAKGEPKALAGVTPQVSFTPVSVSMDRDPGVKEEDPSRTEMCPPLGNKVVLEHEAGSSTEMATPADFHMDSDTDAEDDDASMVAGSNPDTTAARPSAHPSADTHVAGNCSTEADKKTAQVTATDSDSDTDVEDSFKARQDRTAQTQNVSVAKATQPHFDSDTDLEDEPTQAPTVTTVTPHCVQPEHGAGTPHTDPVRALAPGERAPDDFRIDSDTEDEEEEEKVEERGHRSAQTAAHLVQSSTPRGAGLSEEEVETQAFLSPTQLFKAPAPASLLCPSSPSGGSVDIDDFAVAETQSFVSNAPPDDATLDETRLYPMTPRTRPSRGGSSICLDLSDSSHRRLESEERTQALGLPENDWDLQSTQSYVTLRCVQPEHGAGTPHTDPVRALAPGERAPDDFRMDSDTEDEEEEEEKVEERGHRSAQTAAHLVQSSTPRGAGLSEEEVETQAFLSPTQLFKAPARPSLLCPSSPSGGSVDIDDFAVAETQSFVSNAPPDNATLDETPLSSTTPRTRPSRGGSSICLDLSDSSHRRPESEERTQALGLPENTCDLQSMKSNDKVSQLGSLAHCDLSVNRTPPVTRARVEKESSSANGAPTTGGGPRGEGEEEEGYALANSHLSTADTLLLTRSPKGEEHTQPYGMSSSLSSEEEEEKDTPDGETLPTELDADSDVTTAETQPVCEERQDKERRTKPKSSRTSRRGRQIAAVEQTQVPETGTDSHVIVGEDKIVQEEEPKSSRTSRRGRQIAAVEPTQVPETGTDSHVSMGEDKIVQEEEPKSSRKSRRGRQIAAVEQTQVPETGTDSHVSMGEDKVVQEEEPKSSRTSRRGRQIAAVEQTQVPETGTDSHVIVGEDKIVQEEEPKSSRTSRRGRQIAAVEPTQVPETDTDSHVSLGEDKVVQEEEPKSSRTSRRGRQIAAVEQTQGPETGTDSHVSMGEDKVVQEEEPKSSRTSRKGRQIAAVEQTQVPETDTDSHVIMGEDKVVQEEEPKSSRTSRKGRQIAAVEPTQVPETDTDSRVSMGEDKVVQEEEPKSSRTSRRGRQIAAVEQTQVPETGTDSHVIVGKDKVVQEEEPKSSRTSRRGRQIAAVEQTQVPETGTDSHVSMGEDKVVQEEEPKSSRTSRRGRQIAAVEQTQVPETGTDSHVSMGEDKVVQEEEPKSSRTSRRGRQIAAVEQTQVPETGTDSHVSMGEDKIVQEEEPKSSRTSRRGRQIAAVEPTQVPETGTDTHITVSQDQEERAKVKRGARLGRLLKEQEERDVLEKEEMEGEQPKNEAQRGREQTEGEKAEHDLERLRRDGKEEEEWRGREEERERKEREEGERLEKEKKEREEKERLEKEDRKEREEERLEREEESEKKERSEQKKEKGKRRLEKEKEREEKPNTVQLEREGTERERRGREEKERLEKENCEEEPEEKLVKEKRVQEGKLRLGRGRGKTKVKEQLEKELNEKKEKDTEAQEQLERQQTEMKVSVNKEREVEMQKKPPQRQRRTMLGRNEKEVEKGGHDELVRGLGQGEDAQKTTPEKETEPGETGKQEREDLESKNQPEEGGKDKVKPRRGRCSTRKSADLESVMPPHLGEGVSVKITRSRSSSSNSERGASISEEQAQDQGRKTTKVTVNDSRPAGKRKTATLSSSGMEDSLQGSNAATRSRSNSGSSERSSSSVITTSRGRGGKGRKSRRVEDPGEQGPRSPAAGRGRGRKHPPGDAKVGAAREAHQAKAESEDASITEPSVIIQDGSRGRKRGAAAATTGAEESPQPIPKTPRRSEAVRNTSQMYKILFTGVVDEDWEKVVQRLGGGLAKGVADMTHLVTDKVRRTVKFLCAVARGIPIVTPDWLAKSGKSGNFLSPNEFLVKDNEQEKKFNFSLQEALRAAIEQPLLQGFEIHVTPSVKPEPPHMREIIACCGARYLPKIPAAPKAQTVVVSCEEDRALYERALSLSVPVVSAEFLLTGILQQRVDLQTHAFSASSAAAPKPASRGRKKK